MLKDLKPKVRISKFLGYLISCIASFLSPIGLSLFFAWISSKKDGRSICDVYITHVFGQIMQSVLCLLIMVLITYFLYKSRATEVISRGWNRFLSGAAIVCLLVVIAFLVISTLYAMDFCKPDMLKWYKPVVAVELIGAAAGIIVQCLTHPEVYSVV